MTAKRQKIPGFDVNRGDQTIGTGYIAGILALAGPLTIAALSPPVRWDRFFNQLTVWLVSLMIFLSIIDYVLQKKYLAHNLASSITNNNHLLKASLVRWGGWLCILIFGLFFYNLMGHYQDEWYRTFHHAYSRIIFIWLVAGLPYYLLTLKKIDGSCWNRKDPSIYIAIVFRRLFRNLAQSKNPFRNLAEIWGSRTARIAMLGVCVKAFFVPIMFTFFTQNAKNTIIAKSRLFQQLSTPEALQAGFYDTCHRLYMLGFESLFMVDVTLAIIGYVLTTRWLDNGIKSVEQTGLGWLVCIGCYKPFNDVMTWYFLWPSRGINEIPDTPFKLMVMIAVLFLLSIYVWATMAFGLRFSNLTNRGIFTQGPYRYIRHPAYISKNLSWWLEHLVTFSSIKMIFFMLCWNGIYFVRALTEERHLSQDPKYIAYKEHVKWRFIPGIV